MRLVSFWKNERVVAGVRMGAEIADLSALPDLPPEMAALLALGTDAIAAKLPAAPHIPLDGVRFAPVVPRPGKVICIGLNYAQHAQEGGFSNLPDYPTVFMRSATSLCGQADPLLLPAVSSQLDYEGELAVVIGRRTHGATESEALAAVAGYSCFNDGSVRDYQRRSSQWTMGKNFDSTGGFGPELVTAGELPPGGCGLRITTRVNGAIMQDANTAEMIFSVPRLIALLSEVMTLEPGDVIATGTPSGVGFARNPPVWLKAGDRCEVEIEGIGTLRNSVVAA
jgi:2-keto-4-pentenoate hydratase/2-oxohepta-3-ene-1,7-dioic acid hydratase in catechol pathway